MALASPAAVPESQLRSSLRSPPRTAGSTRGTAHNVHFAAAPAAEDFIPDAATERPFVRHPSPPPQDLPTEELADSPEFKYDSHITNTARAILGTVDSQEMIQWCEGMQSADGATASDEDQSAAEDMALLQDLVDEVLVANGIESAFERHIQMRQAKSHLAARSERRRSSAQSMVSMGRTWSRTFSQIEEAGNMDLLESIEEQGVGEGEEQLGVGEAIQEWAEVKRFESCDEALSFVIECQPFDYIPVMPDGSKFPAFATTSEAMRFVQSMAVKPTDFYSAASEFKRRLRVRKLSPLEMQEAVSRQSASRESRYSVASRPLSKEPPSMGAPLPVLSRTAAQMLRRPWTVEASGVLFDRPTSLRNLAKRDSVRRPYYLAVDALLEDRILKEGFKVSKRPSIPVSASLQDAVAAFHRAAAEAGQKQTQPAVLQVILPAGVDVVAHRQGGFLIKRKELPASCFAKRRSAQDAGR
mmetsp:Transcript_60345/g.143785  ORF Transcript_60345/g.143785 Transcript_60345/m.143785 type:complete len:471 (-) Transcript_60345:88-1500(-)